jgi:hypothetical protein
MATAQSKLEFCIEVKEKGECLQLFKSFQVEPNCGTISYLVKNLQAEKFSNSDIKFTTCATMAMKIYLTTLIKTPNPIGKMLGKMRCCLTPANTK